ncbi:MAG: M24 family metallopeptidase C-terminal domain-containing protein [bacterium]|nr:M24 family metallopeptidase C-terminal domain-containing protein [bacterium]
MERDEKLSTPDQEWLRWRPVTLCPIDRRMIDKSLVTRDEIAWLNAYHKRVLKNCRRCSTGITGSGSKKRLGLCERRPQEDGGPYPLSKGIHACGDGPPISPAASAAVGVVLSHLGSCWRYRQLSCGGFGGDVVRTASSRSSAILVNAFRLPRKRLCSG